MTILPIAKINLGLNVVERRPDGYHNLETVFFPVPINDELRVEKLSATVSPSDDTNVAGTCQLTVTFASKEDEWHGKAVDNLVVKAYDILAKDYQLPLLHLYLHKQIPSQAGMGGGSADAAYTLRLINDFCQLGITDSQLEAYAARLGADCAFFIKAQPAYATGIGEKLQPLTATQGLQQLSGKYLALVKPNVAVSTKQAYAGVKPHKPEVNCLEAIARPIEEWRHSLVNDFEESIFPQLPVLAEVKQALYDDGALYAAMSGSGSTIFAIFEKRPNLTKYAQHYNQIIAL